MQEEFKKTRGKYLFDPGLEANRIECGPAGVILIPSVFKEWSAVGSTDIVWQFRDDELPRITEEEQELNDQIVENTECFNTYGLYERLKIYPTYFKMIERQKIFGENARPDH